MLSAAVVLSVLFVTAEGGSPLVPLWDGLVAESGGCRPPAPDPRRRIAALRRDLLHGVGLSHAPTYAQRIEWPHSPLLHIPPQAERPEEPTYHKIVIIPRDGTCETDLSGLFLQLDYNLPADLHLKTLTSFSVWVNSGTEGDSSPAYVQYHIRMDSCDAATNSTPPISGSKVLTKDWLEIEMIDEFRRWVFEGHSCCRISMAIQGLDECARMMRPETKPFLAIQFYHTSKERKKRGRDCVQGMNECCRENLYVTFRDIDWDKWIHHPPGFNAYYCRGSCVGPSTITVSANNHHSVLQKLRLLGKAESGSCCGPTKFSPLNIMVVYPNRTAAFSTIQKMIVEECGCM